MPEYPGSTPPTERYAAAYAGATDDERTALFYELLGDYSRRGDEVAAAFELAEEADALAPAVPTELPLPEEAAPEVESLRAQVAALTGQLAAAAAEKNSLAIAARREREQLEVLQTQAAQAARHADRKTRRLQGKLAVLKQHVCDPKAVPNSAHLGVVGAWEIYAVNPLPRRQNNLGMVRQDEGVVQIRYIKVSAMPGGDEELIIEPATLDNQQENGQNS